MFADGVEELVEWFGYVCQPELRAALTFLECWWLHCWSAYCACSFRCLPTLLCVVIVEYSCLTTLLMYAFFSMLPTLLCCLLWETVIGSRSWQRTCLTFWKFHLLQKQKHLLMNYLTTHFKFIFSCCSLNSTRWTGSLASNGLEVEGSTPQLKCVVLFWMS